MALTGIDGKPLAVVSPQGASKESVDKKPAIDGKPPATETTGASKVGDAAPRNLSEDDNQKLPAGVSTDTVSLVDPRDAGEKKDFQTAQDRVSAKSMQPTATGADLPQQ